MSLLRRGIISSGKLGGITPPATQPQLHLIGDSGFVDQSTNSYTITNAGATQTTALYNGHKALRTDGVNDYFQANGASSIFNVADYDIYLVVKAFNVDSYPMMMSWNEYSVNNDYSYIMTRSSVVSNGTAVVLRTTAAAFENISDASNIGLDLTIINIRVSGSDYEFRINNDTPVTGTLANPVVTSNDRLNFGALVRTANPSGSLFGEYDYAEIKIFDEILDASERDSNISNLASTYGITL